MIEPDYPCDNVLWPKSSFFMNNDIDSLCYDDNYFKEDSKISDSENIFDIDTSSDVFSEFAESVT